MLDLTDDEHAALVRHIRKALDDDRFPLAPRPRPAESDLSEARPAGAEAGISAASAPRRRAVARPGPEETVTS